MTDSLFLSGCGVSAGLHQYDECDQCGEKYWGADIDSYLREVPVDGTDDETQMICLGCLGGLGVSEEVVP